MMKIFFYWCTLIVSCGCTAQLTVIKASHETVLGGIQGARSENFNLIIKNDSKIQPRYLLAGDVKIPLTIKKEQNKVYLKGTYFPEADTKSIDMNGNIVGDKPLIFDPENVVLVYDHRNAQLKQRRIVFKNDTEYDEILPNSKKLPE